jgi:hypothetical protein
VVQVVVQAMRPGRSLAVTVEQEVSVLAVAAVVHRPTARTVVQVVPVETALLW